MLNEEKLQDAILVTLVRGDMYFLQTFRVISLLLEAFGNILVKFHYYFLLKSMEFMCLYYNELFFQ